MTKKQIQNKIDKILGEIDGLHYNFHDENNKLFFEKSIQNCTMVMSEAYDTIERDDAFKNAIK